MDTLTCTDYFHQMLAWEHEDPARNYSVHNLMVLSYNLQHPHLYSPEGLTFSIGLLHQFVAENASTQHVRDQNRAALDSGSRKFKITGTPDSHGSYVHPIQWQMTAYDIISGGIEHYPANIRAWARSVYDALISSGNYANKPDIIT